MSVDLRVDHLVNVSALKMAVGMVIKGGCDIGDVDGRSLGVSFGL